VKNGREESGGGILIMVYCSCQYWDGWYNGVFHPGCYEGGNFVSFIRWNYSVCVLRFDNSYNLDRNTLIQAKSYTYVFIFRNALIPTRAFPDQHSLLSSL
jgi:hypothetical protein